MKKIFLLLLISFYYNSFCQSAKDFLINDNEKLNKTLLTDIISESKNYGYNLYRDDDGEFIFHDGLNKYLYLIKKINSESSEGFPEYFVGNISKRYFFTDKEIDVATPNKIETEITLFENILISSSKIINCFSKIKNDIERFNNKGGYSVTEKTNKVNFKSFSGSFYDLLEINTIEKPCLKSENDESKCVIEHCFSNGICFSSEINSKGVLLKKHSFCFVLEDKNLSKLIAGFNKIIESEDKMLDKLKYTIGGKDIRNINQYDLESMVETFIEDCKINNIIINDKYSLKATFEPLENNVIALSYAYGDDSLINIKVDPQRWAKSNIEKKWYILYHELGHDVLNLEHGQGGKMMFNFADKEYSWDDFFNDKNYMMNSLKDKVICCAIETVKIGSQEWTVKNLDVTRYRNGDIIPEVKDPIEWASLKTGAWCYYDNDPKNGKIYGKLYNWYAVNDPRGLAPEGFHIPSLDEFKFITNQDTLTTGKMKDIEYFENTFYKSKNKVGCLIKSDGFEKRTTSIYYWSSSEKDMYGIWPDENEHFTFANALMLVFGYNFQVSTLRKSLGLYVRCLRD